MTKEQKRWLDDHADEGYAAVGVPGGMVRHRKRLWLHPDGTTEPVAKDRQPPKGTFIVAVREITEPGKGLPSPRRY